MWRYILLIFVGSLKISASTDVTDCGGTFSSDRGTVMSPNYPANYTANSKCTYTLEFGQPKTVMLSFNSEFSLAGNDWVKIITTATGCPGLMDNGIQTYTAESSVSEPVVLWSCKTVVIQFQSGAGSSDQGFKIKYLTTSGCTAVWHTPAGFVRSPSYPSDYPANIDCDYVIEVAQQSTVTLTFNTPFHIPQCCDWVQIQATTSGCPGLSSDVVYSFNGTTLPTPLVLHSCYRITIKFHSDSSVSGAGFGLVYTVVPECGGIFHDMRGLITSPNYPNSYPPNANCVYSIVLTQVTPVTFTFNEQFDLQSDGDQVQIFATTSGCPGLATDTVYTYNGTKSPSPLILQSCFKIGVQFISDSALQGAGFNVSYVAVPGCGGTYNDPEGEIYSPQYPSNYPVNISCSYFIQFTEIKNTTITFNEPFGIDACCDWLQIVRTPSGCPGLTSNVVDKITGSRTPSPITIYNCSRVDLHFKSDHSITKTGFSISYAVSPVCGGVLHDLQRNISSPNFPNYYPRNSNCSYLIDWPRPSIVEITFNEEFSIESCCAWLKISCSTKATSAVISSYTFSGTTAPEPIQFASCYQIKIEFFSATQSTVSSTGFSLSYITKPACSGSFNGKQGTISSPNYSNDYPPNSNCLTTVAMHYPTYYTVSFNRRIAIQSCSNSSCDELKIRITKFNGSIDSKTFSGTTFPSNLIGHDSSKIEFEFNTDSSVEQSGFSVNYEADCFGDEFKCYNDGRCMESSQTCYAEPVVQPHLVCSLLLSIVAAGCLFERDIL